MNTLLYIILTIFVLGLATGLTFGYRLGKYFERKDWNKLIEEGKLPKPNKHE